MNIPQYEKKEIANSVSISKKEKVLLVEGSIEIKFLKPFFETLTFIDNKGAEGVLETLRELNSRDEDKIILGLIDKDYEILPIVDFTNLITTTHRDLEIDLLKSNALKRFLSEKGSANKLNSFGGENYSEVLLNSIFDLIKKVSILRLYNATEEKGWNFKEISLSKCLKYTNATFDDSKFIRTFKQKNSITEEEWGSFERYFTAEMNRPLERITRGHDATVVLGMYLRKKIGSLESKFCEWEVVEENLRLATLEKHIENYEWYIKIKELAES